MAVSYRTTGSWGAGIGRNLTPAEVDTNFYTLAESIEAIENYPPAAVTPTNISRVGSQITFTFSDGSSFTLTDPVASTYVPAAVSTVSGSSFNPLLANANTYMRCTNASGCNVLMPANSAVAFPVGTEMHFRQSGAGPVSFDFVSGVSINSPTGYEAATEIEGATVTIKKVDTNEWDLFGLLAATSA